jgi:hypothetical protein
MNRPQWILTCWSFDRARLSLLITNALLIIDGALTLFFLGAIAPQLSVMFMYWSYKQSPGVPDVE